MGIVTEGGYKTYEKAIETYGKEMQMIVAMEEMSELTKELSKCLRKKEANVAEEMADVMIMLQQLLIIFNNEREVELIMQQKIDRLRNRLKFDEPAWERKEWGRDK